MVEGKPHLKPATHPDALRIQSLLGDLFQVVEFDDSTKTSADAAAAIGCSVAQIAKSILLKTVKEQKPVLVIASGTNRIDEKKVSVIVGEKVKSADAAFVLANAGVMPGGVAPIGHVVPPITVIDRDLQQYDTIWAAGGTANAVFRLTCNELIEMTNGRVSDVAKT